MDMTMQTSLCSGSIQELSVGEIDQVAGGPIFIPPLVVAAVKFTGYALAATGAAAALTVATAKVVDALD